MNIDAEIAAALARVVASIEARVAREKREAPRLWTRGSVGQKYRIDRIVRPRKTPG
jgi:hypothetical protein